MHINALDKHFKGFISVMLELLTGKSPVDEDNRKPLRHQTSSEIRRQIKVSMLIDSLI